MKVLKLNKLNRRQKKEVEEFVSICLKSDGLKRTLYLENDYNFYNGLDCFYLLYVNQKLSSVLTIFQPLKKEAEISAYTLPAERNKGYFKALFQSAREELLKYNIDYVYFVTEPDSKYALLVLHAYKAEYFKSEYLLFYDLNSNNIMDPKQVQVIEKEMERPVFYTAEIHEKDQEKAIVLSSDIFNIDINEAKEIVKTAIVTEFMKCYGAYLENKLIGICNVSYGMEQASIFGFGIAPVCRGKGYGRNFLKQLINLIGNKHMKSITLHVGSENKRAFSLYKSEGFKIKTQYDYYEYILKAVV